MYWQGRDLYPRRVDWEDSGPTAESCRDFFRPGQEGKRSDAPVSRLAQGFIAKRQEPLHRRGSQNHDWLQIMAILGMPYRDNSLTNPPGGAILRLTTKCGKK